ncbi:MAG: cache domain-containing protein, partial [Rhodoferax sp.]
MKLEWRPANWGLSSRIVALSLLLLLIVQAAVFSVVRISIEQSAKRQVEQELQVGERVWRRLLDQNAQTLTQGATVLAADFGFRAAISTQDEATIRSALENNGARINATVTALMDTNMGLRAVGEGQDAAQLQGVLSRLTNPGARDAQGSQVALIGRTPYQFVLVPVRAPVVVGYVLMGFPINQKLLDDMRAISDMHLALISDTASEGRHIVSSTLPPDALRALEASSSDVTELPVDGDRLIARSVKLDAGSFGRVRT